MNLTKNLTFFHLTVTYTIVWLFTYSNWERKVHFLAERVRHNWNNLPKDMVDYIFSLCAKVEFLKTKQKFGAK